MSTPISKVSSAAIESIMLSGLPLDDQLQRVSRLPHNSLIIVSSYRSDASGRSTVARDVVQLVASNANAPTFGYGIDWLGTGIVGGDLIQHDLLATRADDMTARILKGESASAIPLNTEPSTAPIFDARAMARWHVSEAALPVGSTVMFRPPTLWSEHKQLLITGSSIVGVQALFIVALLFEQRRRRVAQTQLSEAEQRYRTVADFTADWEYWVTPNGTFAYLSPSCGSITGYNRDELLERPELLNEMPIDDDRDQWQRCHENAAQSNGPLNFEARIRTKNGNVRWLDVLLSPIASDDGIRLGLRGSARDITSRKQSEAELRQALDENQQLRDRLEVDNAYLREEARRGSGIDSILGSSEVMRYVVSKIQQVAPTSSTVLLLGETGVGKTLLARALHERSSRSARIFVTLNCAAVPPTLVESELFGHEKGAFTGADARRLGRFELALGGTLFLDEIGELPLELQAKLLRAVQEGEFERVGSSVTLKTDVRLIVASNRQLDAEVRAGRFRPDLWYRLNIFPITVPPLRQRAEDLPVPGRVFHAETLPETGSSAARRVAGDDVRASSPRVAGERARIGKCDRTRRHRQPREVGRNPGRRCEGRGPGDQLQRSARQRGRPANARRSAARTHPCDARRRAMAGRGPGRGGPGARIEPEYASEPHAQAGYQSPRQFAGRITYALAAHAPFFASCLSANCVCAAFTVVIALSA